MRVLFFVIVLLVLGLSEYYFIQAIKTVSQKRPAVMYTVYAWLALDIVFIVASMVYPPPNWSPFFRTILSILFILLISKIFCFLFLFIEDITRFVRWLWLKFSTTPGLQPGKGISRLKFLSQAAVGLTALMSAGFIYGILKGGYKYRVHKVKVPAPNLPEAFDGFKIVQLSDIHTGSFTDNTALNRAFDIVMQQGADLILFTGDLVNNEASETQGFESVYSRLKAPHGVYSVMGNHDYGDYKTDWGPGEKENNFETLKQVHASAGWRLLMNEHVALEKDGQQIALIGIENWGGSMHFKRYGRMDLAYKGAEKYPYKILMSHDPSHWDKQVRPDYPEVDLTLSGHTHGMQLGIEIPGIKWSPSQWFYKQWAGLYKDGQQFLYVNRGLGFLGYPGRLGIWPEITVLELKRA